MGKSHCLGLQSRFFCGHVAIVIGPIGGPYPNDSQRMELNSQWLYHASVQITPTAYSYAYHHGMSHPPLPPPRRVTYSLLILEIKPLNKIRWK